MDAPPDVRFRDRALLVDDVLVVADLHLGKGTSGGFELPVGDGADMLERLRSLLSTHDPRTVVVAGDLLHSFRTIPRAVEDTLAGIEEAAAATDANLVVTPGNHDTMLQTVYDGPTPDHYRVGDTVVCHGHQVPEATASRYVVGHDHPTIEIQGRRRPCFLLGDGTIASVARGPGDDGDGSRGRHDESGTPMDGNETAEESGTPMDGNETAEESGTLMDGNETAEESGTLMDGNERAEESGTRTDGNEEDEETTDLIMLPAFNRLLRGVAVNDMEPGDFQSPLCQAAEALAPVVRDDRGDETLVFPVLGEFRHRL